MKYVLFDVNQLKDNEVKSLSEITNNDALNYAKRENGFVFETHEEFQRSFNNEDVNTNVHILRIINN